jgi:hypothetical protein
MPCYLSDTKTKYLRMLFGVHVTGIDGYGYYTTMNSKSEYHQGTAWTIATSFGIPLTCSVTTGIASIDFKG